MRISVKVVPKASKQRLEQLGPHSFKAWLRSPPEKGKANDELVALVAEHFGAKKAQVSIAAGAKSRDKQIDIL